MCDNTEATHAWVTLVKVNEDGEKDITNQKQITIKVNDPLPKEDGWEITEIQYYREVND